MKAYYRTIISHEIWRQQRLLRETHPVRLWGGPTIGPLITALTLEYLREATYGVGLSINMEDFAVSTLAHSSPMGPKTEDPIIRHKNLHKVVFVALALVNEYGALRTKRAYLRSPEYSSDSVSHHRLLPSHPSKRCGRL